jgi:hypothetical protein
MSAVSYTTGTSRDHLSAMHNRAPSKPRALPPLPYAELVADIRARLCRPMPLAAKMPSRRASVRHRCRRSECSARAARD